MPVPIDELVDELKRLKPESPALRHFSEPATVVELRPALRRDREHASRRALFEAQLAHLVDDDGARKAFADYARAVAALLKRGAP